MQILKTPEYDRWFRRIRDAEAKARINMRIVRLQTYGNLGDCKPVGGGILEMRIDHGPGYRLYCTKQADSLVLLLIGGDKSSQTADIGKARKLREKYTSQGGR